MNARNSDFTRSNLAGDYNVTGETHEKLGQLRLHRPGSRREKRRHHLPEDEDMD